MTHAELVSLLEQYRAGLETEIALLRQLEAVAARQREVTEARDYERFRTESDQRDRLTSTLVAIDQELRPIRETLHENRQALSALPDYKVAGELRRTAADLVQRILKTDRDSMKALSDADLARKAVVASLERGETTLAAYRKVIAPPLSSATLLNRRG